MKLYNVICRNENGGLIEYKSYFDSAREIKKSFGANGLTVVSYAENTEENLYRQACEVIRSMLTGNYDNSLVSAIMSKLC